MQKKLNSYSYYSALLICIFLNASCTNKTGKVIKSALSVSEENPEKALSILDKKLLEAKKKKDKLAYIVAIEKIVKEKFKNPEHYKAILEKKILYLDSKKEINQTYLVLAQLLIQNFKDENEALTVLSKINIEELISEQRDQYFQSILISYINLKEYDQALIEADLFLKRKDLSPSEDFKIKNLKSRTLVSLKRSEKAEIQYEKLIQTYPNLSKKWKIRSQLGLILEDQKKYKKALIQLKLQMKEEKSEDPLLKWRIDELSKRLAQQPGGKGKLRR